MFTQPNTYWHFVFDSSECFLARLISFAGHNDFLFRSSNTKWNFFYNFVWRFCIERFFAANWLWLWQLQKHYIFSSLAYLGFIKLFLWFECCQGENYENPLSHEHNDANQNPWFGLKRGKITLLKLWGNWDNLLQIYNCFSVEFFYKTLS